MNATIYSNTTIIGTVSLQVGDESMGCLFGKFIPNENYFKDIQKSVWEFWSTNNPDYNKWHSLRLNALLDNGFFLFPEGGFTFDDSPEFPNTTIRIDIAGADIALFNFSNKILLEPWYTISINQKIIYEDELFKEITPDTSFFYLPTINKSNKHPLIGAKYSAFAKYGPNDDVLFLVTKNGESSRFAIVHLTWSGSGNQHFPSAKFYLDFDEFLNKRMIPDNLEWTTY